MSENSQTNALWTPAWYALDQTLVVGERQKFWFFQEPPAECLADESVKLVFYNQLDSSTNCNVQYAEIAEMSHPQLGKLLRIDTDGLDYIFFPEEGNEVIVNAEEQPGATTDLEYEVSDWSVLVRLTHISKAESGTLS